jgi:NAD(P)-dependent dehydrogenase (short-subunit alcohol dehydrogenase family)
MQELADVGVNVVSMDLTDDASIVDGIGQVVAQSGRVDILVNNAGYGLFGALEDVPLDAARRQFEVNVFGLARLTQLALPHMREHGFGKIVNVSSIGGKIWEPFGGWYHASKFAVEWLSDCARMELREFGINVIVIEPGAIKTEWSEGMSTSLQEYSGDTPYAGLFNGFIERMSSDAPPELPASDPDVIARVILKAVTARRPRTRYSAGLGAKPMLALQRLAPDRVYDALWSFALRHASHCRSWAGGPTPRAPEPPARRAHPGQARHRADGTPSCARRATVRPARHRADGAPSSG